MNVCYVPSSQDHILSRMKFRRKHSINFLFPGPDTFTLTAANGFSLLGHSINDIFQITMPQLEVNAVMTRTPHKRLITQISDDGLFFNRKPERKRACTASIESDEPPPLTCSPAHLWHLRYGHASTTVLSNPKSIRSTHDFHKCFICMRAKKTKISFHQSTSKVATKLGRVHTDICGPYPKSKGGAIYNLTFLHKISHYAFSVQTSHKTSETVKREFLQFIAAVERETGLKVKSLQSDEGGEYQSDLTTALQALRVKA